MRRIGDIEAKLSGLSAMLVLAVVVVLIALTPWIGPAVAQQRTNPSTASYTGVATLTLANAVDSTGAGAGVDAEFAARTRCVAEFSGTDAANDADIEGTVDGTNWHVIDTADPDATAVDLFAVTLGPWSQLRANVVALGAGVDVTITCLATVR